MAVAIVTASLLVAPAAQLRAQASSECALSSWAATLVGAWKARGMIANAACYAQRITSMDIARQMRDDVLEEFDAMFPRAGYKVVGLDPINAALPGLDRPMVGGMYVGMFLADGAIVSLDSAELIITEPDILFSVADARINDATTIEEATRHLDRAYAFIETLAPTYVNNPPNPFLMQASNIFARWGVIGESVAVTADPAFIDSLNTMTVTFRDNRGNVLAEERGDYLDGGPLRGVLVVIEELRRLGQRLAPGDLISSGSYMPPIPVREPIGYETIYEGMGGQTLRVSTRFVD